MSLPIPPLLPEEIEPEWETFLSGLPLDKVEWEKSTEEGQAATAIVHQAQHMKADMIVMGTHGKSALPICSWAASPKRCCAQHPALC